MSTIGVDLPDDLLEFIGAQVQCGEFADVNEYIVALVDAARNGKSELETALLKGLNSGPAEEWTSQDWADIKRRVIERHPES